MKIKIFRCPKHVDGKLVFDYLVGIYDHKGRLRALVPKALWGNPALVNALLAEVPSNHPHVAMVHSFTEPPDELQARGVIAGVLRLAVRILSAGARRARVPVAAILHATPDNAEVGTATEINVVPLNWDLETSKVYYAVLWDLESKLWSCFERLVNLQWGLTDPLDGRTRQLFAQRPNWSVKTKHEIEAMRSALRAAIAEGRVTNSTGVREVVAAAGFTIQRDTHWREPRWHCTTPTGQSVVLTGVAVAPDFSPEMLKSQVLERTPELLKATRAEFEKLIARRARRASRTLTPRKRDLINLRLELEVAGRSPISFPPLHGSKSYGNRKNRPELLDRQFQRTLERVGVAIDRLAGQTIDEAIPRGEYWELIGAAQEIVRRVNGATNVLGDYLAEQANSAGYPRAGIGGATRNAKTDHGKPAAEQQCARPTNDDWGQVDQILDGARNGTRGVSRRSAATAQRAPWAESTVRKITEFSRAQQDRAIEDARQKIVAAGQKSVAKNR